VWDARNFSCVQTFMSQPSIVSFAVCGPHRRLAVVGKNYKIQTFDQAGGPYASLGVAEPVFGAVYNPRLLCFTLAARERVTIWSALTGKTTAVFKGLSPAELTALCLDDRHGKIVVGDHFGSINIYRCSNGAFLRELTGHQREIVFLEWLGSKRLLSCSRDGMWQLHDEAAMETDGCSTLMTMVAPEPGTDMVL
jgi:hypothetical protein